MIGHTYNGIYNIKILQLIKVIIIIKGKENIYMKPKFLTMFSWKYTYYKNSLAGFISYVIKKVLLQDSGTTQQLFLF